MEDTVFLKRAIALGREKMLERIGGPFGALVVLEGEVLATGWNCVTSQNDPTAHAEVVALRRACQARDHFFLSGATLYTSCEPCPMCMAAAYWARIGRVVFASTRADAARAGFLDEALYQELGRSPEARELPHMRLELAEADALFELWSTLPDKTAY